MSKYIILDWAGNRMHAFGEFDTADDAFEHLAERFDDAEERDEFQVIPEAEYRGL